ncbi:ABC transporter ATP-binding protein [Asticcacaulis benevestitus]|uniref:Multidrug ABC transporter ATP-binding protein n=1 Tax=Asticcacaulis benevestitus DSM 16100 = ATCC BAA-896 TaxID=1121022 RepID=V4NIY9_9CAUL|nr:ABC transporter ATP-binding protein [Asticcacaulis benevestitus]ESQ81802.1 multidrug ABC transporter ATP-binding protein [Asticcacaulis benevestitus DSM 16100 = ATCC BAA-896]
MADPDLAQKDLAPKDLAIDVRGLTKRFGKLTVVDQVDIQMPRGQVWGFLGPNGSGKTTTIRMLCGLLKPDAGEGTCLGFDILKNSREIKNQVGYMTQKFSYWEDLTIRENLEFVANLYELKNSRQIVDQTLETLGLTSRQKQLAGTLSGGWKQRLALAACTLHSPKMLMLDEPTAGVDPQARRDFWDQIHRLSAQGLTVLVSTHYMDEAERCDQIVYIAYGKLMAQGRVDDIIDRSGLYTFVAEGVGVRDLMERLRGEPGADHIAYFGNALHVSGGDLDRLKALIAGRDKSNVHWQQVRPNLEDVFIHLMTSAVDNSVGV